MASSFKSTLLLMSDLDVTTTSGEKMLLNRMAPDVGQAEDENMSRLPCEV